MSAAVVMINSHSRWQGLSRNGFLKGFEKEQVAYQRARLAGLLAVKNLPLDVDTQSGSAWITITPPQSSFGRCLLARGLATYSETGELILAINEFGDNLFRKSIYARSFIHQLRGEGLRSTHFEFNYRWAVAKHLSKDRLSRPVQSMDRASSMVRSAPLFRSEEPRLPHDG